MARREHKRPTNAELEILQVLWKHGPRTVREVHQILGRNRRIGHTTALKLMQIMTEKGTLRRNEDVRPQVYRATRSQQHTQRQMVGDMLDRVFSGSPGRLVLHALSTKKTTPEERRQIRVLLDQLEDDSP